MDDKLEQLAQMRATGTCYEDVTLFIADALKNNPHLRTDMTLVIVHAIVSPPGFHPYSHSWVEHGDNTVYASLLAPDGKKVFGEFDTPEFYRLYNVIETTKYTIPEAMAMDRKHGGAPPPWEEKYLRLCKGYKP